MKIAEQMLGTLETIAIGGRLERPKQQGSDARNSDEAAVSGATQSSPSTTSPSCDGCGLLISRTGFPFGLYQNWRYYSSL